MTLSAELSCLRADYAATLPDTCQLGTRSTSQNSIGEPVPSFSYGVAVACALQQDATKGGQRREYTTADGVVVRADALLRLPSGTTLAAESVVKVTHRYGVALTTALSYEVVGVPAEGPSGIVAALRAVTT